MCVCVCVRAPGLRGTWRWRSVWVCGRKGGSGGSVGVCLGASVARGNRGGVNSVIGFEGRVQHAIIPIKMYNWMVVDLTF